MKKGTYTCEIVSIHGDRVEVEIFLENTSVRKTLRKVFVNILREKNLLKLGQEFSVTYTVLKNGIKMEIGKAKKEEPTPMLLELCRELGL